MPREPKCIRSWHEPKKREVLGLIMYVGEPETIPYLRSKATILFSVCYTNDSSGGQLPVWMAVALESETGTVWFDIGIR